ncbi:MAG: hypothetical protein A3E31_11255 [Candidatus Rokubacteria bacterium RIFCSPHIGHO2_12_FULL_73_22]|nr:MAG: hypothetical protein A3D33_04585 [Candidatus Rokubacteria bacterium RIFCSPHIGHO2_02_FULL_73_26]OGL02133.1 MAG: hypothetical protein A3E31_11255 [Candidatus Rokubacteria bacterium RIFCSPHIGHO2_12_FULL_73_22]OGL10387.1 MAG: hypothetical protein A3I14_09845 [Candidatus Rokubacteria bacterium RIFCSPLOWO2_02_FULL_73_56]OGL21720.1 MAG: hypothetical protein A3G44_16470 [Candidatus Rokubacteria bacterium RIFCSPLOWO2_12_FULL_73_47]
MVGRTGWRPPVEAPWRDAMQMDLWYTLVAGELVDVNERASDLRREAEADAEAEDARAALEDDAAEVLAFDFF